MKKFLRYGWIVLLVLLCSVALFACAKGYSDAAIRKQGFDVVVHFDCGENANINGSTNTKFDYYYKFPAGKTSVRLEQPGTGSLSKSVPQKDESGVTYGESTFARGYFLEGWYKDSAFTQRWDFAADEATGSMTLYARWLPKCRFEVYAVEPDGNGELRETCVWEESVEFGSALSSVKSVVRNGYTLLGLYNSNALDSVEGNEFVASTPHPGALENFQLRNPVYKIYAKWLEGNWTLVDTVEKLNGLVPGRNVYLTQDLDFAGKSFKGSTLVYAGKFEGNGHTIRNVGIDALIGLDPQVGLFKGLAETAVLKNVTFGNVTLRFKVGVPRPQYLGLLAGKIAAGATLDNVSIDGSIQVSYETDNYGQLYIGLVAGDLGLTAVDGAIPGLTYTVTYAFDQTLSYTGTIAADGKKSSFSPKA